MIHGITKKAPILDCPVVVVAVVVFVIVIVIIRSQYIITWLTFMVTAVAIVVVVVVIIIVAVVAVIIVAKNEGVSEALRFGPRLPDEIPDGSMIGRGTNQNQQKQIVRRLTRRGGR